MNTHKNWYLDTEFLDDGRTIDPISIALVSDVGEEFYAMCADFDYGRIAPDSWLDEHVSSRLYLPGEPMPPRLTRAEMADALRSLLLPLGAATFPRPRFWAYFADYDWIVLCQTFGPMIGLPKGLPHLCLDIKQEMIRLGIEKDDPRLPKQDPKTEHNALADARHDLALHRAVMNIEERMLGEQSFT